MSHRLTCVFSCPICFTMQRLKGAYEIGSERDDERIRSQLKHRVNGELTGELVVFTPADQQTGAECRVPLMIEELQRTERLADICGKITAEDRIDLERWFVDRVPRLGGRPFRDTDEGNGIKNL